MSSAIQPFLPSSYNGLPRDHISVSQIRMYLRCPAQYYFHYVEGIKLPPTGSLVLGKAVHAGLEYYFWQKIFVGKGAPLADVLDVFSTSFEKERAEAVWSEDAGKVKDDGVALIKLYLQEAAPKIMPIAVEKEVRVSIANTVLLGYIDLITADGKIIDFKVTAKSPSENKAVQDIQLSAYALAYRELYRKMPSEVRLDFMVRSKIPKLISKAGVRNEGDLKRFIDVASGVIKSIGAKSFYPNPDNFMCRPSACGYWEECHKIK